MKSIIAKAGAGKLLAAGAAAAAIVAVGYAQVATSSLSKAWNFGSRDMATPQQTVKISAMNSATTTDPNFDIAKKRFTRNLKGSGYSRSGLSALTGGTTTGAASVDADSAEDQQTTHSIPAGPLISISGLIYDKDTSEPLSGVGV